MILFIGRVNFTHWTRLNEAGEVWTSSTLRCISLVLFLESRWDREQESGYFSPDRRDDGERQLEEVKKRQYRYYERGHPLPSNYVPEPKACVPYRNVNLGVPSERRNPETYLQDSWRSESPERYTYHSNFRQGSSSQRNSPTRHSSVSPDRYKLAEPPVHSQRRSSISKGHARSQSSSYGSSRLPSRGPSRQTSGRSSPNRRRGSMASRMSSPSRAIPTHRRVDSSHSQNSDYDSRKEGSQQSRNPSRASNKHSLDSEKLYRNLESISRRGSSAALANSYRGSQASPQHRTAVNSSVNTHSCNSRELSPSRNGFSSPQQDFYPGDNKLSASLSSWRGSSHSVVSRPPSRGSAASRCGAEPHALGSRSCVAVTDHSSTVTGARSQSNVRRGMEALLMPEPKKVTVESEEVVSTVLSFIHQSNRLSGIRSIVHTRTLD